MRLILAIIGALILHSQLVAQPATDYIVKAGQVPGKVLPAEVLYVLPSFKQGTVYMRNGEVTKQWLNYNIILDEMQFLGAKGDTLTIAEPALVKNIRIDSIYFFYDKTYLQLKSTVGVYKLAIKQFFVQTPYRTRGGYGISSGVSAISTFTSMGFGGRPATNLMVDKDVAFHKLANFYIGDAFNRFYKADKKTFLNIFAEHKSSIEKYLRLNKTNFHNPAELQSLLEFCTLQ